MTYPTPAYRVTLDGQDLTARIAPRLSSLTLTEKRGQEADQLDLVIQDSDGRMALPKKGAVITLELGWKGEALVGKGTFKVDEVEHSGTPDIITVRARSADFTAELRVRQEKSWRDTTLGQVLKDVAGRHGLTAQVDAGLAGKAIPVLQQSRESDAALLKRLGRRYDATATIKAGRLIFAPIGKGKTATGKDIPSAAITRADGDQHSWKTADRDSNFTGVSASWHSRAEAKRHTVRAGAAGKVRHLKTVYSTEADAKQAAAAEKSRLARQTASFSMSLALGRPDIYPEQKVTVQGWKPEIDATKWLVEQATHKLDDSGLTTDLQLEVAA